jgi:uncharacterized protein
MIIKVKVIPKSSQNIVVGFEGDVLKVKCTAPPEKGKANASAIKLIAEYYKVPKSAVTILFGKASSVKLIEVKE